MLSYIDERERCASEQHARMRRRLNMIATRGAQDIIVRETCADDASALTRHNMIACRRDALFFRAVLPLSTFTCRAR